MHPDSRMHVPYPASASPGVYIHIPFCSRICPYCDFNVYARSEAQIPAYLDALKTEFNLARQRFGATPIQTVFIGGGTPSLLEPHDIHTLLEELSNQFTFKTGAEISMEANPEGLTSERLSGYRAAGINRLSIGVQTQQQHGLKVLGRAHKPDTPARALPAAREAGFDNLSLDFIFGWPGQTVDDWKGDLDTILEWAPEHVSMYSLIVEPGTAYQRAVDRGILTPTDDDTAAEMYDLARERMSQAGWDHYEISNWAKSPEFRSRHNIVYWANSRYLAFGAGAHGYMDGLRYSNTLLPKTYIETVIAGELPIADDETIPAELEQSESMILGLRLVKDGVSTAAFEERHGSTIYDVYGDKINELVDLGLLDVTESQIRLSERGLLLGNDVAIRFLPDAD